MADKFSYKDPDDEISAKQSFEKNKLNIMTEIGEVLIKYDVDPPFIGLIASRLLAFAVGNIVRERRDYAMGIWSKLFNKDLGDYDESHKD